MSKQLIITSALPYANGPLHFGHLLEHVQTDIWVRTNKLLKNECIYLCASDAHGTPIMMKAESENVKPEELVNEKVSSFVDLMSHDSGSDLDSDYILI